MGEVGRSQGGKRKHASIYTYISRSVVLEAPVCFGGSRQRVGCSQNVGCSEWTWKDVRNQARRGRGSRAGSCLKLRFNTSTLEPRRQYTVDACSGTRVLLLLVTAGSLRLTVLPLGFIREQNPQQNVPHVFTGSSLSPPPWRLTWIWGSPRQYAGGTGGCRQLRGVSAAYRTLDPEECQVHPGLAPSGSRGDTGR